LPAIPVLPGELLLLLGEQRLGIELFDDVQETQADWEVLKNRQMWMVLKMRQIEYVNNQPKYTVLNNP
jgi:hypothetical protein